VVTFDLAAKTHGAEKRDPFQEVAMGNLGLSEMLLIGIALLIFFGPSRLPELGKSLGKGIQEFKKASRELTDSVKDETNDKK
jgi:sec-independent protein translocase protein TatA